MLRLNITALLLSLFVTCAPAYAQIKADRPDVKVGDTWVYQRSDARTGEKQPAATQVVESIAEDKIVIDSHGEKRSYTRDLNITEIRKGETVLFAFSPSWQYFSFPMEQGKQWEGAFTSTSRNGQRVARWQWKVSVDGAEKVTVPAGSFDTLRLKLDGFANVTEATKSWTARRTETLWYAPAVKRHIKSEFEESAGSYYNKERVELVSFKLAGN